MQRRFIIATIAAGIALAFAVLLYVEVDRYIPDRTEIGPREAAIRYDPVPLGPSGFGPLRLAGAWRLSSPDSRFGGISGLAVDGGELVAITDWGVALRFPKPSGQAAARIHLREVPDGPGRASFKRQRDAELLMRDPRGRGWWVGFEFRNQLWLYDDGFDRALQRITMDKGTWPPTGFEAAVFDGNYLLLFPESGGKVLLVPPDAHPAYAALDVGPVSDAMPVGDGELLLVGRRATARGFENRLILVRRIGGSYRSVRTIPLGVTPVDNVEGIAIEPRRDGGMRLWLITDDGFTWPMRTLLVALDWPAPPRS